MSAAAGVQATPCFALMTTGTRCGWQCTFRACSSVAFFSTPRICCASCTLICPDFKPALTFSAATPDFAASAGKGRDTSCSETRAAHGSAESLTPSEQKQVPLSDFQQPRQSECCLLTTACRYACAAALKSTPPPATKRLARMRAAWSRHGTVSDWNALLYCSALRATRMRCAGMCRRRTMLRQELRA